MTFTCTLLKQDKDDRYETCSTVPQPVQHLCDADALATGGTIQPRNDSRVSAVHPEPLWRPSLGIRNCPNTLTAKSCLVQILGMRVTDLVVGHLTGVPSLTPGLYITCSVLNNYFIKIGGTQWRSWSRYCATNRKVAGSIPDGVIGIFHCHNPSGHTVALGSTQPLTEYFLVVKAAGA